MRDLVLESRLLLARPRPEVFAFVADPRNLPRLLPRAQRLRVNAPPALHAGAVLDMEVRWLGVSLRWRAFVREWDPPYRFVDVQVRGPWARWEHRHRFLEADGGTLMLDRIVYRPPLGPLGRLAHVLLLERQLRRLWAHRQRRLAAELGSTEATRGRAEGSHAAGA